MKLVDLKTAKTLQELGYDGEYSHYHASTDCGHQIMHLNDCEKHRGEIIRLCAAPRLDDAAYFIRDKYEINIVIDPESGCKGSYRYIIYTNYGKETGVEMQTYDPKRSYEDALEDAIIKVIEIIKYDE